MISIFVPEFWLNEFEFLVAVNVRTSKKLMFYNTLLAANVNAIEMWKKRMVVTLGTKTRCK